MGSSSARALRGRFLAAERQSEVPAVKTAGQISSPLPPKCRNWIRSLTKLRVLQKLTGTNQRSVQRAIINPLLRQAEATKNKASAPVDQCAGPRLAGWHRSYSSN